MESLRSFPASLALAFNSSWRALGALPLPFKGAASFLKSSFIGRQSVEDLPRNEDLPIHPPHVEVIRTRRYLPPQVTRIITRGGGNFIGFVDDTTVLKYPCVAGDMGSIQVEAQILDAVGKHPRIIESRGLTEYGLLLAYARNGSLYDYISLSPSILLSQKLHWCRQAAEAVEYIHTRNVIHCDINLRNLLLDDNLNLVLTDFQGMLKDADGKTLLDGFSRECSKSFAPRSDGDHADRKTDLFALGSAIYFIMMGHEVFPDLTNHDDDDDEIEARFRNGLFPADDHPCAQITQRCWKQQYESANDLLFDLKQVQLSASNEWIPF
ncbi:uncharacterized protein DSM5745_04538 [Aspergillus mulundensis]|uniref:non-specific serine/threonine protein kinase n=1 Tax=Aspergillus mulundensis TaxID=1810919 RepID=A0A3D8SCZ4_9EURO|nr:Uncharacterized protein DSM5745_04538 [Aspergillus mulundensis]RDW84212.1 Uncharacterized protein DSM5745_04538 [Aspergillus mulundensis]